MASREALRRLVATRDSDIVVSTREPVEIDFQNTDPREIERHCASKRVDKPREARDRYDVAYCAYCAVFHDFNEGFSREQQNAEPEERFCVIWSNRRSRELFRLQHNGGTLWPTMATAGKGNICEIATDRRWAFTLTNVPRETRRLKPPA